MKDLKKHVRLENLSPSYLIEVVSPSGIFSGAEISSAFKALALLAENLHGVDFIARRFPMWITSAGSSPLHEEVVLLRHMNTMLDFEIRPSATYAWTLEVVETCSYFWAGIAAGDVEKNVWLGK